MPIDARGITILDVGHGNSAVVLDKNGVVIIDAGPGDTLRRHLRDQGIQEISCVLISHSDKDHLRGVTHLLGDPDIKIRKVIVNPDAAKTTKLWEDLVYELSQKDIAGEVELVPLLVRDLSGAHDVGDMHIEVLGPSKYLVLKGSGGVDHYGTKITGNGLSATVRILRGETPICLLPGDIDLVGLRDLEDADVDAQAPVIVWPHHGGHGGVDDAEFARRLLALVKPRTVLFSIGRGAHGMPRPSLISAIRTADPHIEIRCTQLSTHCQAKLLLSSTEHLANIEARGKERKTCCGGSTWLSAEGGSITPAHAEHQRFISAFASTPLCR